MNILKKHPQLYVVIIPAITVPLFSFVTILVMGL